MTISDLCQKKTLTLWTELSLAGMPVGFCSIKFRLAMPDGFIGGNSMFEIMQDRIC
jgi:hypothetical protein